jgi:hypothetical protein
MLKWILRLFHRKDTMSSQWLYEQSAKEAGEGWTDGPRWRFPAEIVAQERLERKRRMSLVKEKERKRA